MSYLDGPLQLSVAQSITTSAASTTAYDVTGAGSGNATNMTFGMDNSGNPLLPGTDIGAGLDQRVVEFDITTTGTGTGTITFSLQAAPDNGSNAAGSYVTIVSSAAYVGTTLIAGDKIILPIPPAGQIEATGELKPRFYQAYYTQTGNGAVSVTASLLINPDTSQVGNIYGSNFVN